MNKRIQGFIAGSVVTALLLTGSTVFADSIDALFNQINIKVNGNQVAKQGDNYTLSNGETTPFSISYNGTTYLPMRKVAELLGKDVQWDAETNTANITERRYSDTNKLKFMKDYTYVEPMSIKWTPKVRLYAAPDAA